MSATQPKLRSEHIQSNWVLVVYGIPTEEGRLRGEVRKLIRAHGLWSIDIGGSVYLGPRVPDLDAKLAVLVQKLAQKFKITEKLGVHFIVGDYDAATASFFRDQLISNIQEDQNLIETSLKELEQALVGEVTIKDPKGKERNLLTLGRSRIATAYTLLDGMEAVVQRFNTGQGLRKEAETMRLRIEELRSWVGAVEKGFKRWAIVEEARQKKEKQLP